MANSIPIKDKLEKGILKISRFKEIIKRTQPHKHDRYYELIFLSQGEGFHWIETQQYKVNPPDLFFMKPDHIHYWQFTSIPKGFVLLFRNELMDPVEEAALFRIIQQLNSVTRINCIEKFDPLPYFEAMLEEFINPGTHSLDIILGHLRTLFANILKYHISEEKNPTSPSSIYDRYISRLTEIGSLKSKKVSDFARELHTSPQNLNRICKKKCNKSAGQLISQQLVLEAKRNILHTDKSVNELADLLDFNDASYFVKFFKKHVGETPNQFRSKYFN